MNIGSQFKHFIQLHQYYSQTRCIKNVLMITKIYMKVWEVTETSSAFVFDNENAKTTYWLRLKLPGYVICFQL